MLLDAIALGILALYAVLGLARGTLASASGLVSLVVGYLAGFAASLHFGGLVAERLGVSELIGTPLAGTAGFLVAWFATSTCFRVVRRRAEKRRAGDPRGAGDRLGGAVFGLARGALIVLLLGWLSLWVDAARSLNTEDSTPSPLAGSSVAGLSGAVVESAITSALSDSAGGRAVARIAAKPAIALGSINALLEDPRVQAVQEDSLFWTYVQNGAVENALNRRSFWRIVHDDELRQRFADLGMVSQAAAAEPGVFREAASDVLVELAPHLKGLSEDIELRRLAQDPEVVAMLEAGDTFGLLTHPGIRKIASRVSTGVSKQAEAGAPDAAAEEVDSEDAPTKVRPRIRKRESRQLGWAQ